MGRGDKRSKKGKIWRGSFGNCRPKVKKSEYVSPDAKVETVTEETTEAAATTTTTEELVQE